MIFDIDRTARPNEVLLKADFSNAYGVGGFSSGKCSVIVTANKIVVNYEYINQKIGDATVGSRAIMIDSIRELHLVKRKDDRGVENRVFLAYDPKGGSNFIEIIQASATPMNIQIAEAVYNCILKTLNAPN